MPTEIEKSHLEELEKLTARLTGDQTDFFELERSFTEDLEDSPIGFCRFDDSGKITWANKYVSEMLGYTFQELLSLNMKDIYAEEKTNQEVMDLLRLGKPIKSRRIKMKCKDGTIKETLIFAVPRYVEKKYIHSIQFLLNTSELTT